MKKSLIIFSLLFFTVFIAGQVQAQKKGKGDKKGDKTQQPLTPEEKAQKSAVHMQKKLLLGEEQKQQIYKLNLDRINKTRALRSQASDDTKSKGAEYKKIRTDYEAQLKSVLTTEQYKKWETLKAEAKARRDSRKSKETPSTPAETEDDPEQEIDNLIEEK